MSHTNTNHNGLQILIFFWTLVFDFSLVIEVHYFPYCSQFLVIFQFYYEQLSMHCKLFRRVISMETKTLALFNMTCIFYDSDMECYLHLFSIPGSKDTNLLCFTLILLQWHNSRLPNLHLWLPKQNTTGQLCKVSLQNLSQTVFSFIL